MNTNELMDTNEYPNYSAHQTGWGAAILKREQNSLGKYNFLMEIDLADLNDPEIYEEGGEHMDDWFNDGSTYGK